jgi:dihydrofolate reductase
VSRLKFEISVSLDGFVAGPNQSLEHPLGEGGEQLHEWAFKLEAWRRAHGREGGEVNASTEVVADATANIGANLMGRKMFGGGPGPWAATDPWNGWWGENPPFHTPVVVLTHHSRAPLELEGGTTFHFVTEGIEAALELANELAGGRDVHISGGADAGRQYLAAGLVDEMWLHVVPVLLGGGTSLFDEATAGTSLVQERVVEAPGVAHLRYRRAG